MNQLFKGSSARIVLAMASVGFAFPDTTAPPVQGN